ncbi:hypothetical protein IU469_32090 [Nocardia puris]|uniref:hypothetical protein n=1 Tax=Nocardia puris TaxID=208602 RepID=UPI0011BFE163|nr:hypothetical protein [Nocardia puris]MBF6215840.1 hypothetical protein [Nocardia puris]MBF6370314.1 hypothetical protein [Nocardia puris]
MTPSAVGLRRTNFSFDPPPEATVIERHGRAWQAYTAGEWAGTCLAAVSCLIPALREFGIDAEPLAVHGSVTWPNGVRANLGRPEPDWAANGCWTGHMVLWIPALGRLADPTVYQANRPDAPTTITRGLMITLPDGLATFDHTAVTIGKDGALVHYDLVRDFDCAPVLSRARRPEHAHKTPAIIDDFTRHAEQCLRSTTDREHLQSATYPPLVAALRAKNLID